MGVQIQYIPTQNQQTMEKKNKNFYSYDKASLTLLSSLFRGVHSPYFAYS